MVEYIKALYGLYMPNEKFEGQGLVEYALILGLIAIAAILVMTTLGGEVRDLFQNVVNTLQGVGAA